MGICEKLGPPQPRELCIEIAEHPGVHQRIIDYLDAPHEMTDMERDLLDFGKEVRGAAVQRHTSDRLHRHKLLGHQLRRVEQVDSVEVLVLAVGHDLNAEFPLGEGPGTDRVVRSRR